MKSPAVKHQMTTTESNENVRIHAKTIVVVLSINFIYFAQLVAVVGSGLLGHSITGLFHNSSLSIWPSSIVAILTAALSPSVSQIADYWGRKWILVIFTTLGFVGSIVISRAQSIATVLVGFSAMAISFGSQPLLLAVVSEVLPRRHRPNAQASSNNSGILGGIVGIVMGGALVRHGNAENYRIYFYVLSAIFAASAIGCAIYYNPPLRELQKSLTTVEKLRKLDWIGYALFVPGLVLFCMALAWSKNPYGWSNAHVLATFVASVVLIFAFFVYEWRFKADGILNHGLFQNRNFPLSMLLIFCEGLAFWATNNYFSFEVGVITGADLLVSGLHFVVAFGFGMAAALGIGLISSRWKVVKIPMALGFLLLLGFNIGMAAMKPSSPHAAFWGITCLAGLGLGTLLPLLIATAQMSTPPEFIATTTALLTAVRSVGGAVGLAINTALLNGALATNIPVKTAAATIPLGLPPTSLGSLIEALASSNETALAHIPGVTPQIIQAAAGAIRDSYAIGFRDAWIAGSCFTALGLVASLFVLEPSSEFTAHIDAPVEQGLIELQARTEGARDIHDAPAKLESEDA